MYVAIAMKRQLPVSAKQRRVQRVMQAASFDEWREMEERRRRRALLFTIELAPILDEPRPLAPVIPWREQRSAGLEALYRQRVQRLFEREHPRPEVDDRTDSPCQPWPVAPSGELPYGWTFIRADEAHEQLLEQLQHRRVMWRSRLRRFQAIRETR